MSARTERLRRFEKQRKHRRISWRRCAACVASIMPATPQWVREATRYIVKHTKTHFELREGTKVKWP